MGTIAAKLQAVADSKAAILAAIVAKGQDMTDVALSGYAAKITELKPANAIPNTVIETMTVAEFIAGAVLTNPEGKQEYTYTLADGDYAGLKIVINAPAVITSPISFDATINFSVKFDAPQTLDLHNLCLMFNTTSVLSYVAHYVEGGSEIAVTQSVTLPAVTSISLLKLN